ncbi:MAG: MFS transporter, partial [Staphylococcus epidermidis]|nr:MFS transporter [Staphylococcus epidermidis]
GPSLLGLFTHMISYSQLYGIMGILGFATLVIYIIVHGRKVHSTSY